MMDIVGVLIADDHPLFREGMRGRLDRVDDIVAVVGEAESGDEVRGGSEHQETGCGRRRSRPSRTHGARQAW